MLTLDKSSFKYEKHVYICHAQMKSYIIGVIMRWGTQLSSIRFLNTQSRNNNPLKAYTFRVFRNVRTRLGFHQIRKMVEGSFPLCDVRHIPRPMAARLKSILITWAHCPNSRCINARMEPGGGTTLGRWQLHACRRCPRLLGLGRGGRRATCSLDKPLAVARRKVFGPWAMS